MKMKHEAIKSFKRSTEYCNGGGTEAEEQRQCRRADQNGTGRRKVEFSLIEN